MKKMKWCSCALLSRQSQQSPLKENAPSIEKLIFQLGLNLEFESKVHQEVFWTPSLDLDPNVNPP